jgi:hypothetical protein
MLDFLVSDDAPLGKIVHYFWRREYQQRGLQHFHLLLWVDNAPILGENSNEEVASFILKYVTCAIPEQSKCPTLHKRVNLYQVHKHNNYCMRRKKIKHGYRSVCRFGFPRQVVSNIALKNVAISIAGRKCLRTNSRLYNIPRKENEVYINDYNAAVLYAWPGNVDIQYVGEISSLIVWYVTKYLCKFEKGTNEDTFDDINSTKSLFSRLYNVAMRCLTHRECGALEAADTLLRVLEEYTFANNVLQGKKIDTISGHGSLPKRVKSTSYNSVHSKMQNKPGSATVLYTTT